MSDNDLTYITNISEVEEANPDFPLPIFCFPEIIDKKPINFLYCIVYILGCALFAVLGFYYYFKGKKSRNEYLNDKPTPLRKYDNKEELPRMLSIRQDSRDQGIP